MYYSIPFNIFFLRKFLLYNKKIINNIIMYIYLLYLYDKIVKEIVEKFFKLAN